tara:strand:+ start:64 stop:501 length:438 start_codon:yes stop_codon:yes gene_type:complete
MAEQYVIAGLVRKRAELAGRIERTYEELRQMVADLETTDAALALFDPDFKAETIKPRAFRPPKDWSNRGEMSRMVLSILRQAQEPLTSRDIALEMLVTRALDPQDEKLLRLMVKRVGVALRHQKDAGRVKSEQGPGQFNVWEIER